VQQWVGLINEIMNANSWMVLKTNHCYQRNGWWKAWCGNRTVTRKSSIVGLCICAVGLDILKFEQTSLFYSSSYFNLGRGLQLCFGKAKPTKAPPWRRDCVAKLQLAF